MSVNAAFLAEVMSGLRVWRRLDAAVRSTVIARDKLIETAAFCMPHADACY